MTKRIKVLVCEPGKIPYVKTIKNDWQDMSQIVGGFIEFVRIYPGAQVSIVCNDEGMIRGMPLNREIFLRCPVTCKATCKPRYYVSIYGPFFLVGTDGPDTISLTSEEIEQFSDDFRKETVVL